MRFGIFTEFESPADTSEATAFDESMAQMVAAEEVTTEVFRNYGRLLRVVYDIVTPPEPDQYQMRVRWLGFANERCEQPRPRYVEPPPVVIL